MSLAHCAELGVPPPTAAAFLFLPFALPVCAAVCPFLTNLITKLFAAAQNLWAWAAVDSNSVHLLPPVAAVMHLALHLLG